MSVQQENVREGAGDDQEDAPDPSVIQIVIKDRNKTYTIDKTLAMVHSLYFERIMSGPWANAQTGIVELEEGDHATPRNVKLFIEYLKYAVDWDPLTDVNGFDNFAKLWLFADYMQCKTVANAVMDEIAFPADGSDDFKMSVESFVFCMLVASGHITEKARRHGLMPSLPADAQEAIIDEMMRQHADFKKDITEGLAALRQHLSAEGVRALAKLSGYIDQKVVGGDYHSSYGN